MVKRLANVITSIRILCSVLLLFFPVFSLEFYLTYSLCGISDMIDGTIARKTNSDSKFGAKFDTIADFIFLTAAFCKLLPNIPFPKWAWIWLVIIAALKTGNALFGVLTKKEWLAVHTVMNKITGFFLFLFPLTLSFIPIKYSIAGMGCIATFAAIQEGYLLQKRRKRNQE